MAGKALLDQEPNPTEEQIKKAIQGNICRCTGYKKIIEGIALAAAILRGDSPMDSLEEGQGYGVGRRAFRIDARGKVLGTGEYCDDVEMEGMVYASAVRSEHPRAKVLKIDTEPARAMPGVLAALAALKVNWPVKVKLSRQESIRFHPKRHYMEGTFTLGCDENGIFTGLDCEIYFDTGAYASLCGPVLERACTHSVSPYCYQNTDIRGYGYYTNNPPAGAFRGFGVCQSEFALESNINLLAEKAGISPWEIRFRNAIEPGKVLPNGQIADCSTALKETLLAVKDAYERNPGRAGIACAMKNAGVGVGSGKETNIEAIAALEPDLAILSTKQGEAAETLTGLGIPTVLVEPETYDAFNELVEMLGKLCGCEAEADELAAYYASVVEKVTGLTADVEERPSVYLCGAGSYLRACAGGMYQRQMIDMAGGDCVSAELEGAKWADISAEQLAAWDPQYIFAVSYAEYTLEDIRADGALSGLRAVAEDRLYTVPSEIEAWDYPQPSSILGLLWMAHVLHPELVSEEEYGGSQGLL